MEVSRTCNVIVKAEQIFPEKADLEQTITKPEPLSSTISTWFARRRIRATKEYVNNIDMASFVPPPPPPLPEEPELQYQQDVPPAYSLPNSSIDEAWPAASSPSPKVQPQIVPPTVIKLESDFAEKTFCSSTPIRKDTEYPDIATDTRNESEHGDREHRNMSLLTLSLSRTNEFEYKIKQTPKDRETKNSTTDSTESSKSIQAVLFLSPSTQSGEKQLKKEVAFANTYMNCSSDTVSLKLTGNARPPSSPVLCSSIYKARFLPKPPPLIRDPLPAFTNLKKSTRDLDRVIRRLPITHVSTRPPKLRKITDMSSSSVSWGPMMSGKPWSPPNQSYNLNNRDESKMVEDDVDRSSPPAMIPIDWVYPDFRYTMSLQEPTENMRPYGNYPMCSFGFRYPMFSVPQEWLWHSYAPIPCRTLCVPKNPFQNNGK